MHYFSEDTHFSDSWTTTGSRISLADVQLCMHPMMCAVQYRTSIIWASVCQLNYKCSDKWIYSEAHWFMYRAPLNYSNRTYTWDKYFNTTITTTVWITRFYSRVNVFLYVFVTLYVYEHTYMLWCRHAHHHTVNKQHVQSQFSHKRVQGFEGATSQDDRLGP